MFERGFQRVNFLANSAPGKLNQVALSVEIDSGEKWEKLSNHRKKAVGEGGR